MLYLVQQTNFLLVIWLFNKIFLIKSQITITAITKIADVQIHKKMDLIVHAQVGLLTQIHSQIYNSISLAAQLLSPSHHQLTLFHQQQPTNAELESDNSK